MGFPIAAAAIIGGSSILGGMLGSKDNKENFARQQAWANDIAARYIDPYASQIGVMQDFAMGQASWARGMAQQQVSAAQPMIADLRAYAGTMSGWSDSDRAHYEKNFKDLETSLATDARTFNTAGKRELYAGKYQAETKEKFSAERRNAQKRLEGLGVDPSQIRSSALDTRMRMGEAAAMTGAANQGRQYVEKTGRDLRTQAIGVGQANATRAMQEKAAAAQMQQAAGQISNASYAGLGAAANAGSTAMAAYGAGLGDVMNAGVGLMGNAQPPQSNSGDMFANAGLNIGQLFGGLNSEGGAVPPPPGQAIPMGPGDDQVIGAKSGEYVIPQDVVSWKGQEFFENTMRKSREGLQTAAQDNQMRRLQSQADHQVQQQMQQQQQRAIPTSGGYAMGGAVRPAWAPGTQFVTPQPRVLSRSLAPRPFDGTQFVTPRPWTQGIPTNLRPFTLDDSQLVMDGPTYQPTYQPPRSQRPSRRPNVPRGSGARDSRPDSTHRAKWVRGSGSEGGGK